MSASNIALTLDGVDHKFLAHTVSYYRAVAYLLPPGADPHPVVVITYLITINRASGRRTNLAAIANELKWSRAKTGRVIKKFQDSGYVVTLKDGRNVFVDLAKRGRASSEERLKCKSVWSGNRHRVMLILVNPMDTRILKRQDEIILERDYAIDTGIGQDAQIVALFNCVRDHPEADIHLLRRVAPGLVVHIVLADTHDPGGYRFDLYDNRAFNGQDWSTVTIGSHPNEIFAESVGRAYFTAKTLDMPTLSLVNWKTAAGAERRYLRLIYPLDRDRLLIASRLQREAGPGLLGNPRAR